MPKHDDYMSGPHDSERCSCRYNGARWLARCTAAAANDRLESARWAADHIRQNSTATFTPEYCALASNNEDLR